ncbi:MAG: hypothetical protein ABDH49_08410 [Candidatus Hydrothermales bacterium]
MKFLKILRIKKIKVNPPFNLIFSTGDTEIFSHFYNGVLQIKKENDGLRLSKRVFPIRRIHLNKDIKIKSSCAIFKTVGIYVLNNPEEDPKNFEDWFIVPEEENLEKFNSVLQERMLKKYKLIKGKRVKTDLRLTSLSQIETSILIRQGKLSPAFKDKSIKKVYIRHYGGFFKRF